MTDYQCPACGGGFPAADADGACPWCGEAMAGDGDSDDTTVHTAPIGVVTPPLPLTSPLDEPNTLGPHFAPDSSTSGAADRVRQSTAPDVGSVAAAAPEPRTARDRLGGDDT